MWKKHVELMFSFRSLAAGLFAVAVLAAPSISTAKKPNARYFFVEQSWDRYENDYGEAHPAVVVESRASVEIKGDYNVSIKQMKSRIIAVFDVERAENVFNYVELVPSGVDIESVHAWSKELGQDEVKWAESSDIHKQKMFGGYTELRVAVPGFSGKGTCGYEIELEGRALPDHDFMTALPVIQGEYRLLARRPVGLNVLTHGAVEKVPVQRVTDGELYVWKVKDLPGRSGSPILSARNRERAEICWASRRMTWGGWAEGLNEFLSEIDRLPKDFVRAAKDSLKGKPPEETVAAVFRTLDDPKLFKPRGRPRRGLVGNLDWEEVFASREASSLTRTVMAHLLLRELGIPSHLVHAASRHETILDWRDANPFNLDASLLLVPSLGEDHIVDVGNRSVPFGYAGGDLYPEMFVVDPENDVMREFKTWNEDQRAVRRFQLLLDEDGLLEGALTCSYEGMEFWTVDPWQAGEDQAGALREVLGPASTVSSRGWRLPESEVRCYRNRPVVFDCDVEMEAEPHGESGWAIPMPSHPLPETLADLVESAGEYPVFLHTGVVLEDSILIAASGGDSLQVGSFPENLHLVNRNGTVSLSLEDTPEGILIIRNLRLKPGEAYGKDLRNIVRLCEKWNEAGEQKLVVSLEPPG